MKRTTGRPGPALLLAACSLALLLGGCSSKEPERASMTPVMVARNVARSAPQGAAAQAPPAPAAPEKLAGIISAAPGKDNAARLPLLGKDNAARLSPASLVGLYNPAGKRNPFLPYLRAAREGKQKDLGKLPPLQRTDISEFRYVGIIKTRKGVHALLETSDGKGYDVQVGTRLGRDAGVVTSITSQEIAIREETVDSAGNPVVRSVLIKNKNANAGGKQ